MTAQPHTVHILVVEDDKGRREILLKKNKYSIGRGKNCDIVIQSPFVSRHHATIMRIFDEEGLAHYHIIDGNGEESSANGIIINGKKVNNTQLKTGDKVVFGPQVFAIYHQSSRDIFPPLPPDDPFDITLIDPAMMGTDFESP
ncbi:MAG: FHA domain-containing protein [Cyanobacterium sp.]